jgi:predicted glycosyltransferase
MRKPVILIYRQYSEGIGKLLQCLALARSLRRQYHPVVLNNGALPGGIEAPEGVDVVQMPACNHKPGANVVSLQNIRDRQQAVAERGEFILQQYLDLNPAVLMIDTFPFGDSSLGDELMPLLERAKNHSATPPNIICCLQDIQRSTGSNSNKRDDKTARLLERYFDLVLVHTDPVFARLEEFFQPKNTLSTAVHYTGFLLPGQNSGAVAAHREKRLLISAGGGTTGEPLFRAAVEAHRLLWAATRLPMTIITGPLVTKKQWMDMQWHSRGSHALTIKRSVPNLGADMRKVHWSVSQCGYGAATEAIDSRVSALFVPSNGHRSLEQMDRAHRLAHWGAGRLLVQDHLNGVSLANEIMQLTRFSPRETGFSMTGLSSTIRLVNRLTGTGIVDRRSHAAGSTAIH